MSYIYVQILNPSVPSISRRREYQSCITCVATSLFFCDLVISFIDHSGLQSKANRWTTQVGANCHSPSLLSPKTCLARTWATQLRARFVKVTEKLTKLELSSRVSLMMDAILERWLAPSFQSFTNSWLSVYEEKWLAIGGRGEARIYDRIY